MGQRPVAGGLPAVDQHDAGPGAPPRAGMYQAGSAGRPGTGSPATRRRGRRVRRRRRVPARVAGPHAVHEREPVGERERDRDGRARRHAVSTARRADAGSGMPRSVAPTMERDGPAQIRTPCSASSPAPAPRRDQGRLARLARRAPPGPDRRRRRAARRRRAGWPRSTRPTRRSRAGETIEGRRRTAAAGDAGGAAGDAARGTDGAGAARPRAPRRRRGRGPSRPASTPAASSTAQPDDDAARDGSATIRGASRPPQARPAAPELPRASRAVRPAGAARARRRARRRPLPTPRRGAGR